MRSVAASGSSRSLSAIHDHSSGALTAVMVARAACSMPGHSGGFCHGLASAGIKCCTNGGMGVPQIEDDAAGVSAGLVKRLLKEMAGLFPDSVMHIGDRSPHGFALCWLL